MPCTFDLDQKTPASDVGAASLVLWRDPANDAATYAAKNIECGMVKSFRQARQLL
jgi:hypothetical protein